LGACLQRRRLQLVEVFVERMDEGEIQTVSDGIDEAERIGERLRADRDGAAP